MRRTPAFVLAIGLLVGAGPSDRVASAADITVGSLQTSSNREGTWLRDDPKPLGKRVTRVPFGAKVKVVAVRDMWARVSTETEPIATGWCKLSDLVEPATLSGGAASAVNLGSSEVSMAGRQLGEGDLLSSKDDPAAAKQANDPRAGKQFDRKSESTFRTMDAKLDAAYPIVDKLEKATPTEDELEQFILDGRLGGTAAAGSPSAQGNYAMLKLLGATGKTDGVSTFQDGYTPFPPAMSEADLVQALGTKLSVDQEYWLGRAVAAAAIARYGLDPDEKLQALVRKVGSSIVLISGRLRGTFGGYHFAVLDTKIPNGISGPGGFVLLTRGAVDLARNEDELAGMIAHEMAHVHYSHGEQVMRTTQGFQSEYKKLKEIADRGPTAGLSCDMCGAMAKALGASAKAVADKLADQGYAKEAELEADWSGSLFLCEVGYRASAIAEYLEMMPSREGTRWTTHPPSDERIEVLRPLVFKHGCPFESDEGAKARMPRYKDVTGSASASTSRVSVGSTPK